MARIRLKSIGFTHSTAEHFFDRLISAKVKTVIDVRLSNTSQLAGFAKATDLPYFLNRIAKIRYIHQPLLAPDEALFKAYRKEKAGWDIFSSRFMSLMKERRIEDKLRPEMLDRACLLCSEAEPHHCHRRLVSDYLNDRWGGVLDVEHL